MQRASEGLDDEHRSAAVSAQERGPVGTMIGATDAWICDQGRRRLMQKLAGGRDVGLALGVCEQAVVTDAVKASGQHVQQEAAHELWRGERHGFVASAALGAVVLPAERDAAIVERHEA